MIIEYDGICYDTNDREQNEMLQRAYKGMYEDAARPRTNLQTHVAGINQACRESLDFALRNTDSVTAYTKGYTDNTSVIGGAANAVGAAIYPACVGILLLSIVLYILGVWSFHICWMIGGWKLCV